MAGLPISELPALISCQTDDLIAEVSDGVTSRATMTQVAALMAETIVTPINGGIVYTDANSMELLAPTNAAGRVLQSGNLAAPTWSTPTYPSTSGTAGQILASDGTNIIYSTASFPVTVGVAGSIIISDGTNWIASTSLFPNTVGSSGTLLRSNGTSNAYSTSTFADTYTANNLLYASASNTVAGLATANNGVLITNGSGVPSISSTLPTAVQGNITTVGTITSGTWNGTTIDLAHGGTNANLTADSGGIFYSTAVSASILPGTATAGRVLQSGASASPSWSTPTYPSTSGTAGQILASDGTNIIYSTASFPVTVGVAGSIIISDGTNWIASTSLFPNTVGSSGTILRSNGTSNAYSTATYPNTTPSQSILYSASANAVTTLSASVNTTLICNNIGILSFSSTLPTAIQANITTLGTVTTGTWNGTNIDLAHGGTNANLTASNGGIFYSTATAGAILSGTATAGQMLQSGSSAAPSWSTATWPATTTINQILYSSAANTVAGISSANSATMVTSSTGVPSFTASMTNGQVLIGSTGATPTPATLTAGTGVSITNAAASITISASGGGYSWTEVTGTSQSMSVNNGYIANNASLVTLTLPSTAAQGSTVTIQGKGAGLFRIAQNSGQTIHASSDTTTGTGGSLTATARYDSIELLCITANTDFAVLNAQGIFTIV